MLASRPDPLTASIVTHLQAYTRVFLIHYELNWYRLVRFLSACKSFRELQYVNFNLDASGLAFHHIQELGIAGVRRIIFGR